MSNPPEHESSAPLVTEGAPRWVKVLGVIVLVLVVGALIIKLTGGAGGHGPARHGSIAPIGQSHLS